MANFKPKRCDYSLVRTRLGAVPPTRVLLVGADSDRRNRSARPAGEAVRQRLASLHRSSEQVDALGDEHVRVVGHRSTQFLVGRRLSLRRELLLLSNAGVGDLSLQVVDALLRGVVVLDVRSRHGDDLDTRTDSLLQRGLDRLGIPRHIRSVSDRLTVCHLGKRVVRCEHLGQRGRGVVADQRGLHPLEVLVVLVQDIGLRRHDPPGDDSRHTRGGLASHADGHTLVAGVLVDLHGSVKLVHLGPRSLDVETAVHRRARRLTERRDDSHCLGSDHRQR